MFMKQLPIILINGGRSTWQLESLDDICDKNVTDVNDQACVNRVSAGTAVPR